MNIDDWNASLHRSVVESGVPERRLYLYVDRGVLATAAGIDDAAAAIEDFCSAYGSFAGGQPFSTFYRRALAWRRQDWQGPCPFVAALAMTVLAVTEDAIGGSHGIYRRQNALLGLPADAVAPPTYEACVPGLWGIWNEWLQGPGRIYGKPSAKAHRHWTYQGWARSQGLVRLRDRILIEDFLAGVRHSGDGPRDTLTDEFLSWLVHRGQRGERLLEIAKDPAGRDILSDVLADEAHRWLVSGARTRPTAGGQLQALLFYDTWDQHMRACLEIDDRLAGTALTIDGERHTPTSFEKHLLLPAPDGSKHLLRDGGEWELAPGLKARLAPVATAVLYDEPSLGGLLQVRGSVSADDYTVLVRDDLTDRVAAFLRASQASMAGPSAVAGLTGWNRIDRVKPIPDSATLRELGLGSLAVQEARSLQLSGGLPLSSQLYLAGGEPDLIIPPGRRARLDGQPIERSSGDEGAQRVALAEWCLDPAGHEVIDGDERLAFRTITSVREQAVGSSHRVDLRSAMIVEQHSAEQERDRGAEILASGAVIERANPPAPRSATSSTTADAERGAARLWIRVLPGRHAIVVCQDGSIREVFPQPEEWLREIDIAPHTVDVLRAVRTMDAGPRLFLEYAPKVNQVTAIAIPDHVEAVPGRVAQVSASRFLSQLVVAQWRWIGCPNESARRTLLTSAMRPVSNRLFAEPKEPRSVPRRSDVRGERITDNPYDDVLNWLSERQRLSASMSAFGEAWAWSCRRYGMDEEAIRHRQALHRLADLGFIEVDWARRRVHAAAPAAIRLAAGNGLMLLAGARPSRLLERLEDDQDEDPRVAEATSNWIVHFRTQLQDGRPIAPTMVYLESDPGDASDVEDALTRLGLTTVDDAAGGILSSLPTQEELLRSSLRLRVSPARTCQRRKTGRGGAAEWEVLHSDSGAGLYRYQLTHGDRYAWRAAGGADLLAVNLGPGIWLDESQVDAASSVSRQLHYRLGDRMLLVPRNLGLPWPVRRALTLRTGLLPTTNSATPAPSGIRLPETHHVYRNIDARTADTVARLLGREPLS